MIPQFEKLTKGDQELLMKAPVLLSVLASCSDKEINKTQKADAIKLAHIKTFTAVPLLRPYYMEVEKNFQHQFEETAAAFYPFDESKRGALKMEIRKVQDALNRIDKNFADALTGSLHRYASHVKRATHSIFQDFMFPVYIRGLNDIKPEDGMDSML